MWTWEGDSSLIHSLGPSFTMLFFNLLWKVEYLEGGEAEIFDVY